jgi:hypothetical protein
VPQLQSRPQSVSCQKLLVFVFLLPARDFYLPFFGAFCNLVWIWPMGGRMRKIAVCGAMMLLLMLGSCASPYADEGLTGGYDAQQIEPGVWRVTYSGNGYTTQETVQTYWLHRCAEIALSNGYDGFEILSDIRLISYDPDGADNAKLVLVHGGGGGYVYVPVYIQDVPKPVMIAEIRLLKRPFTAAPPKIFDAAALKAALDPIVNGKSCDLGNVCPHPHTYLNPDAASPTKPS